MIVTVSDKDVIVTVCWQVIRLPDVCECRQNLSSDVYFTHLHTVTHVYCKQTFIFSQSYMCSPQLLPLIQTRRLRFFGHCGMDGRLAWPVQGLTYVNLRATQGLETPASCLASPLASPLRILEADLQPLNHGLNSAWRHAQDRGRWKQFVETATLQSGARPWWWWWWYMCSCDSIMPIVDPTV